MNKTNRTDSSVNQHQQRKSALGQLLHYMGNHKFEFLFVAILVTISGLANLIGTYMLRPIINAAGDQKMDRLATLLITTIVIYVCGVIAAWGYTQIMARSAQQVTREIRHDLFKKMQDLPLKVFDTTQYGDLMARFTSDVDTVNDALKQCVCFSDSKLYPISRNNDYVVCAQLETVTDCCWILCIDADLYFDCFQDQ